MSYTIQIEMARNGYVVRDLNDGSEPETLTTITSDDPVERSFLLLGEVLDLIGHVGSKYDERRVQIIVAPGKHWEPPAGQPCAHEYLERWEDDGVAHWSCRCGQEFAPQA